MGYQTDCRYFSGYKPCTKNESCTSQCPSKEVASPRILIVHLEALGAVLRGTTLVAALKKKWPRSHITWVTHPVAAPLLENNPSLDRIIKNDHDGVLALSTLSFDYGMCVDKSLVAAGLMEVPKEITTRRGFGVQSKQASIIPLNAEAGRLYELGLSNHEKFYVNQKSEQQLIVEAMGLVYDREPYGFFFTESEKRLIAQDEKTYGKASTQAFIGLNTGCSSTIPYKKFTVRGWIDIVDLLKKKIPEAKIVLLGGREDAERNREIHSMRPDTLLTPTDDGLRAGLRYTQLCDVVITGDSLGMHMAIALQKWVVAWFGPTCPQEIDFYDRGVAIPSQAPCSPCWKRFCDKAIMCYDQVDFDQIVEQTKIGLRNVQNRNIPCSTGANKPAQATL